MPLTCTAPAHPGDTKPGCEPWCATPIEACSYCKCALCFRPLLSFPRVSSTLWVSHLSSGVFVLLTKPGCDSCSLHLINGVAPETLPSLTLPCSSRPSSSTRETTNLATLEITVLVTGADTHDIQKADAHDTPTSHMQATVAVATLTVAPLGVVARIPLLTFSKMHMSLTPVHGSDIRLIT